MVGWQFDNTYARLPADLHAAAKPMAVRAPRVAILNHALADQLGLNLRALSPEAAAALFTGQELPAGAQPLAQAYAGHQFGGFTMLGDGRAILLGEHRTPAGTLVDVQFKGPGPTPYSRRGDGRAALGPMLREYVISEAMAGLGIPTTRSLAVALTGEQVFRAQVQRGAVLTRVAASHIRVGTFQYAAARRDETTLKALADYTIARHYQELAGDYLAFFRAVADRQAALIAKWMHVGFIHGVMNTDNMAISGETIDYGPCAFMNAYDPMTVFSSIDSGGRYAYASQPGIAQWNLARFAESLLTLIDADEEKAVAGAMEVLTAFPATYERYWLAGMRAKLGLRTEEAADGELVTELLGWMHAAKADFTNTFRDLGSTELLTGERYLGEFGVGRGRSSPQGSEARHRDPLEVMSGLAPASRSLDHDLPRTENQGEAFNTWYAKWTERLTREGDPTVAFARMNAVNPASIARNHRVEEALSAAERDDFAPLHELLAVLASPFASKPEWAKYTLPPADDRGYQTFCGT